MNESSVENDEEYSQVDAEITNLEQKGSVFQIKGLGCNSLQYGTGFFVEENIVVTNAHVVAGVNSPRIIHNGDEYDLDFISLDPNSDLAILRTENFSSKPLQLGEAEEGEFGTILAFVKDGNKVITEVKIREKILAVGKDIFGQPGESREALSLEARIESGFSGAPVLNEDSAVVGVVFSRSRGGGSTAYAVQSSEVKKILKKEPDLGSSTSCIP
ncbi:MAG: hypothetical protein CMD84_00250 [Gammaproteobacteria bacterium]|nr:hypothetical protein [Gammaproteobacteria bacterium]